MKDTPIYFTRCGSFKIQELLNTTKNKPMTKLFEIEEQAKYDGTRYYLKIDGSYVKSFSTFEEAKAEYEEAITWIPTKTILLSKEVEI